MAGMNVYGELMRAQLQNSASDLTPTATGLVYFNTTTGLKWYSGSAWLIAADTTTAQVFTAKDYNGGTASDTSRVTLPKNTTANLNALTRKEGTIVYDTDTDAVRYDNGASLLTLATTSNLSDSPFDAQNYSISASVAANALTVALKTKAGTDPTGSDVASFSFRDTTLTSGVYTTVNVTSALSLVVSSGSTLGVASGAESYHYVYLISNAGTAELAISTTKYDDGDIISTSAEGGAGTADSSTLIYSTTARTSVAVRLIGKILSLQTTAGQWATGPAVYTKSSDLLNGGYVHGVASGVSVPTGFIGQVLTAQNTGQSITSGDQDFPSTTITLTPGVWLVNATAITDGSGSAFDFSLSWKVGGVTDTTAAISFVQSGWNNTRGTLNLHPRYVNVAANTDILLRVNPSTTLTMYAYLSAVRIA